MTICADSADSLTLPPPPLGMSIRHRRFVIGGYVLFDPIALARPSMRPREIELLTSLLASARNVVEFGAGGSTMLAAKLGVQRVTSVESDLSWIARIACDPAGARAQRDGRLKMLHADIGPVGMLGRAKGLVSEEMVAVYSQRPWRYVDESRLDIVLIDGRFRLACVLESALRVERSCLIAIHDFWNRPDYKTALPFLDEVARRETLGVFRRKNNLNTPRALSLLKEAMSHGVQA